MRIRAESGEPSLGGALERRRDPEDPSEHGHEVAGEERLLKEGNRSGTVFQELRILRRMATGTQTLRTLPVQFVPMTGKPSQPAR